MKYVFFTTGARPWFELASRLHDEGIATPVLWVGDPRHEEAARDKFGASVVQSMDTFVHFPWRIVNVAYSGEHNEFFSSNEYYVAKDRALKMMDRLDIYGALTRLDREVYFKNICLFGLKKIYDAQPNALVTTESPHSHAQFTLYMICKFLGIPSFKMQPSPIIPAMVLKALDGDVVIKPRLPKTGDIYDRMREDLKTYVARISGLEAGKPYETAYLAAQRRDSSVWGRVSRLISRRFLRLWGSRMYQRAKFWLRREYNPSSPSVLQLAISGFVMRAKRLYLNRNYSSLSQTLDLRKDYVYFGLHYEPERNTNPDGGAFQDQLLALIELRRLLPDSVFIYVKEHPSQLYRSMRGVLGRSPLFYAQLHNRAGVNLVEPSTSSMELIRNALFVSTITGSLGNEAAIQGKKALIFGDSWYRGMPNVIKWHEGLTFDQIMSHPSHSADDVLEQLVGQLESEQIAGCHNTSGEDRFRSYLTPEFRDLEASGLFDVMRELSDHVTKARVAGCR